MTRVKCKGLAKEAQLASRRPGACSLRSAYAYATKASSAPLRPHSSQEKASPRASSGRRGCVFVISHGPGSGKLHKIAYIGPELIVLHKSSTKVKSPRPPSRAPRPRFCAKCPCRHVCAKFWAQTLDWLCGRGWSGVNPSLVCFRSIVTMYWLDASTRAAHLDPSMGTWRSRAMQTPSSM